MPTKMENYSLWLKDRNTLTKGGGVPIRLKTGEGKKETGEESSSMESTKEKTSTGPYQLGGPSGGFLGLRALLNS